MINTKSEYAQFKLIKKNYNSKVFYKVDVVVFAIFLSMLCILTPFDWSVGATGTSTATQEKIMARIENGVVSQRFFTELFYNGNMQSGGYVQKLSAKKQMYYYEYGNLGRYEEPSRNIFRIKSAKLKQKGMLIGSAFVSLNDDGSLYYETLGNIGLEKMGDGGIHGTIMWDWRADISDSNGYDYAKITSLLDANSTGTISLKDGIVLSALILENSLIGYRDGTAWFVKDEGSNSRLIKSTSSEVTDMKLTFEREGANYVMVADNEYFLFGESQGRLGVYSLSALSGTFYTITDANGKAGEVNAFTYDINEDGTVRIHAVSDSFYWFASLTGNGVDLTDITSSDYSAKEDVIKFDDKIAQGIAFCDNTTYLFFGNDNYHYYELR